MNTTEIYRKAIAPEKPAQDNGPSNNEIKSAQAQLEHQNWLQQPTTKLVVDQLESRINSCLTTAMAFSLGEQTEFSLVRLRDNVREAAILSKLKTQITQQS